jgi:hypothetical protein
MTLWQSKCQLCGLVKRDAEALRKHVIADHNQTMCSFCMDNLKCFPSEFVVYTQEEYLKHLKLGDKNGSEGHPNCEFCRKRFFDKTALFMHLHIDHFTCHICDKDGIKYRYYQNYNSLEKHFRQEHHLCDNQTCIQKRFIVFASEFELASHRFQWHPQIQVCHSDYFRFWIIQPCSS